MQIPIFMNMIKKMDLWYKKLSSIQYRKSFRFYIVRILCIFASSNFPWTYQNSRTSDKVTNTVFYIYFEIVIICVTFLWTDKSKKLFCSFNIEQ